MIVQTSEDTMALARSVGDNVDAYNPLESDPDTPANALDLGIKETQLNSYTYTNQAFNRQIKKLYMNRDAQMREQNILPAADITNGDLSQDNLNAIDQQVEKLDGTTRSKYKILTNQEIMGQVKTKIQALRSEVASGKEQEGILGNLAAGLGSWIASIPYGYKRSLVDAATNVAMAVAHPLLISATGITGGASLAADAAIQTSLSSADAAYDKSQSNKVYDRLHMKHESVTKAALGGAVGGAIGFGLGQVFHGIRTKFADKLVDSVTGGVRKVIGEDTYAHLMDRLAKPKLDVHDIIQNNDVDFPMKYRDFDAEQKGNTISYKNFTRLTPYAEKIMKSDDPVAKATILDSLSQATPAHDAYDVLSKLCGEE